MSKKRNICKVVALFICLLLLFNCQAVFAADENSNTDQQDAAMGVESLNAAGATAPTTMWVEPSEANGIPANIFVFKKQTGNSWNTSYIYELYLPGNANLENCFLSWDGGLEAAVGNETYSSGACPIPPLNTEQTYSFKNGTRTTTFKTITYQGSSEVTPVFIEVDESNGNPTIAQMDADNDHVITCVGDINIDGEWYDMTKMKGRGNATWNEAKDKKPYNITLDTKINFPGIDSKKTKKWTFLAEVLDRSLLCNRSGYSLAYKLGIGQDTTSADVWMNGEYQGCYTVTPKTDSFVTDDGFLIEQDNYKEKPVAEGGDPHFALEGLESHVVSSSWTSSYNFITVKKIGDNLLGLDEFGEPIETTENIEAAAADIQEWLQEAWEAIRSDTGYNSKNKYYTDYIDIESFAKMYLMHEYVKSYDVCAGSILFHRDGTSDSDKLYAGPLWDLDNAMGSTYNNSYLGDVSDRRSAEGAFISRISNHQNYGSEYKTSIYKTLGKHADFMEEVEFQYNKNKTLFDNLDDDLDQMIIEIRDSAIMNHTKVIELGTGTGKNNHYYKNETNLGSGQYRQTYYATPKIETNSDIAAIWDNYAANLMTYIQTRSLWFADPTDGFYDPDFVDPDTCEHAYEVIETVPATCLAEGVAYYHCPICRDSYTQILPKIEHDYQNGSCSMCGEELLNVTIACDSGASVTVYETQNMDGACEENAAVVHPRNSNTRYIDCSGEGQVNMVVNVQPGYELVSVTAAPKGYKNIKGPDETGIANGYRITKVSGDFTITVQTRPVVQIGGCTLSLEGDISINFYLVIPNEILSDTEAYITLNDEHLPLAGAWTRVENNITMYGFKYQVVAKEMQKDVVLKAYDGSGELLPIRMLGSGTDVTDGYHYSVQTYIQLAIELRIQEAQGLTALVEAMSDYGSKAQSLFNYQVDDAAGVYHQEDIDAVTIEDLLPYKSETTTTDQTGISFAGSTLILETETTARVYFTVSEGSIDDYNFTVDGKSVMPVLTDKGYAVSIPNIKARKLDNIYNVEVKDAEGAVCLRVEYGALSYAYAALTWDESTPEMKELAKALYLYNQKANAFFGD